MWHRDTLLAIVRAGLLAPSGDNCQPWRFVWDESTLHVHVVPDRAASLYDVDRTASWIALGATLTNMRLVARQRGWETNVALFPAGAAADLVARLQFRETAAVDDPLCDAIATRCTNRRPYAATPLPADARQALVNAVQQTPGAQLDLIERAEEKSVLARLAALNDRVLFENRRLHDGLYRWLRWTAEEAGRFGDGMPIDSLELAPTERAGFRLLGSWALARAAGVAGLTKTLPWRTCHVYRRSSAIGLLTMTGTPPEAIVAGGEALQRLWLTATHRQLAFQPITGLICLLWRCRQLNGAGLSRSHRLFIEAAGRALAQVLPASDQRIPMMLFRIGIAQPPTARALRRPVEDVLISNSGDCELRLR